MLRVPQIAGVRYRGRGNGPQSLHDLSCVVEPTHMGVAGGEDAMWEREGGIVLDRKEQLRHCLIEATAE